MGTTFLFILSSNTVLLIPMLSRTIMAVKALNSDYSNDPFTCIHHRNLEVFNEVLRGQDGSISCCSSLSTESIFKAFMPDSPASISNHVPFCCVHFRTMSPCAITSNYVLKLASNHVSFEPCPTTQLGEYDSRSCSLTVPYCEAFCIFLSGIRMPESAKSTLHVSRRVCPARTIILLGKR